MLYIFLYWTTLENNNTWTCQECEEILAKLGSYRVRPLVKVGKDVELTFQVVLAQIESQGPMARAELATIAGADGGEFYDSPVELLAALEVLSVF